MSSTEVEHKRPESSHSPGVTQLRPIRSISPVHSGDLSLEPPTPFVIGIAGGSASGKTSVAQRIHSMLPDNRVAIITQDSFYRNLTPEEQEHAADFNWDQPDAFDWAEIKSVLEALRARKVAVIPRYDYAHNCRSTEGAQKLWNVDVVIFEGILSFYEHPNPDLRLSPLMDLKIFVETDGDTRLARRIFRDTQRRGRTIQSVLAQYSKFVKPAYDTFIAPLRKKADIIIPWGDYSENVFEDDGSWKNAKYPAMDMIVEHIQKKLAQSRPAPFQNDPTKEPQVHENPT